MERLTRNGDNGKGACMACALDCPKDVFNCLFCHKMTEMICRLGEYEETGLEPEEIVAMKNAIMGIELAKINEFDGIPLARMCELAQAEKAGRIAIELQNDPLTLEELREMCGEPVWVESQVDYEIGTWAIVEGISIKYNALYLLADYTRYNYGKNWLAYRRKPEEGKT